jgi:hypothetical protein
MDCVAQHFEHNVMDFCAPKTKLYIGVAASHDRYVQLLRCCIQRHEWRFIRGPTRLSTKHGYIIYRHWRDNGILLNSYGLELHEGHLYAIGLASIFYKWPKTIV